MSTSLEIHLEAMEAAQKAAKEFFDAHGEPMFCGFAWIKISNCNKNPNKRFIQDMKVAKSKSGRSIAVAGYEGGYEISTPAYDLDMIGWKYQQSMDIKEAACGAYAKVLIEHGIDAFMRSRPD